MDLIGKTEDLKKRKIKFKDMQTDLTYGTDCRDDEALFITSRHINGWEIDEEVKDVIGGQLTFFRVIDENGEEEHGHGWIKDGRIVQWG